VPAFRSQCAIRNAGTGRCERIGEATASARILHSALSWLRSDAVRVGLSGQCGDRRNISAQMRRENVSSVPALQRGLTPKRRHQDLPFRATRPAADPIFSRLPDGTFPRKCGAKMSRQSPHCSAVLAPKRPPGLAVPRDPTSSRSNFFTPSCPAFPNEGVIVQSITAAADCNSPDPEASAELSPQSAGSVPESGRNAVRSPPAYAPDRSRSRNASG